MSLKISRKIFLKIINILAFVIWFGIGVWGVSVMLPGMAETRSLDFVIGFFLCIAAFIIHDLEKRFIRPQCREEEK